MISRIPPLFLPIVALSLAVAPSTAQTVEVGVDRGDGFEVYAPYGPVQRVLGGVIDDFGRWVAWAEHRDAAGRLVPYVVSARRVEHAPGQALAHPVGTSLVAPRALFSVAPSGDLVHSWTVSPAASPRIALLWNDRAIALQGELASAPGLPAGSTYEDFRRAEINAHGQVLVNAELSSGPALLLFQLDAGGVVRSTRALLFQDPAPVAIALNGRGDWLAAVRETAHPGGSILFNGRHVARAGDPAPLPRRSYTDFGRSSVDLDDVGHYVFTAAIDGGPGASVLVRDGRAFAASGDVFPALAPAALHTLLDYRVALSNSGDVYWRADTDDGSDAFLRNHAVLARARTTALEGREVAGVRGLRLSPSGRFWVGGALLGADEVLLATDAGLAEPILGCGSNPATLALVDGLVLAGQPITFELGGASGPGSSTYLYFSPRSTLDADGCGTSTAFGESFLDPRGAPFVRGPVSTGRTVEIGLALPNDPALIGAEFHAQGFFLDPTAPPRTAVALTNGIRLEIGAP